MGLKRGFLFSIDALIASIIIVSGVLIYSTLYIEEKETTHLSMLADDMLNILSELKVSEVDNEYLDYLRSQGKINDENYTLIEQIGELWALNDTDLCQNLVINLTDQLFPRNFGFSIALGNEEIHRRDFSSQTSLVAARKMISGYEKLKPVKGSTSRAYLTSIKKKRTASFAYFGGFVGQGNITSMMEYIPKDAELIQSFMELDISENFSLYINNAHCDDFFAVKRNMTSTRWNISDCNNIILNDSNNNFTIIFKGELNHSYVGGGYIKTLFKTRQLYANDTGFVHYFPGIEGIINLYSSVFIPGTIHSMEAYLHFMTNNTIYLTMGNTTIFHSDNFTINENQDTNITLNRTYLASKLDYSQLDQKTVPLRFGTEEITSAAGILDIILVNDRSGSMAQSGWTSEKGDSSYEFSNVNTPGNGWSNVYTFDIDGISNSCNFIEIEAENYTALIPRGSHSWAFRTAQPGFEGSGYLKAEPDSGTNINSGYSSTSPELQYQVNLPRSGTYFVWIRGYGLGGSSDSVHFGIDGTEIDTTDRIGSFPSSWTWMQDTMDGEKAYFTAEKGTHTLSIWMREDGFMIDKIILTDDLSLNADTKTCSAALLNGSFIASLDWARRAGYIGSEGSEFVINLRRPNGQWIFSEYNGRPNSAGGTVDPDGSVGHGNEFYSGIATKPQEIHVQYPETGTWQVAVYGWNLRPKTSPPPNQHVNISIYIDHFNQSHDNIGRKPTILSWQAAQEAAKSFVDDTASTERVGYVRFGSFADLAHVLSFDKNSVKNAIDNTGREGGTAIDTGIDEASTEFTNARTNATKIMIVLTDGQNDNGPNPVIASALNAKSQGAVIFTIGLTGFVNEDMLQQVASLHEYYYYAPDASVLSDVYEQISNVITAIYNL